MPTCVLLESPKFVPVKSYGDELDRCVGQLSRYPAVRSIYQIGSVSTPGISDIDIVVVTADRERLEHDPRAGMSVAQRYLFAHSLYGIAIGQMREAARYTAFHNYTLKYGEDVIGSDDRPSREVEIQTALEFLVRMYIVTEFECSIRVCKIRSLLLHTKALNYDFEFLRVTGGELYDLVQQIVCWRNEWFTSRPSNNDIRHWRLKFRQSLFDFLSPLLGVRPLGVPWCGSVSYSRSIRMHPGPRLGFRSARIGAPRLIRMLPRTCIKVANRLSRFDVDIPIADRLSESLDRRYQVLRRLKSYNARYLPSFLPLASSLGVVD